MKCAEKDCPALMTDPPTPHALGDNECGYLNAYDGPKAKSTGSEKTCRRPNCAKEFMSKADRDKHEADATKHRADAMYFLCDWQGHADAIADHNFCPVCQ